MVANPAKAGEELYTFCVGLRPRGFKRMDGMSRMNQEVDARICGSVGVRFPCATRPWDFAEDMLWHVFQVFGKVNLLGFHLHICNLGQFVIF